jgi:hypothetical protein
MLGFAPANGLQLSRRALLQAAAGALLSLPARSQTRPLLSAAAFIDSVGVNTHLSSEPYAARFERVSELLEICGIRHLRDELRPDNKLNQWRELFRRYGVRSHLLVSPATNTVTQMLDYLAALGIEAVSAIEGQNEGDADWFMAHRAARGNWSATVVAYQREIFRALRARYKAAALPVLSPTVLDFKPGDMRLLDGAADFCDFVAIHPYAQHAEEPETDAPYAAISWYLENMRDGFKPGAPAMATETGYNTMVQPGGSGVSEEAAAIYIPRLLLNNFAAGIRRTFLYQLLDAGRDPAEWEHHWGLVRDDDTPKPAFHAIAGLLGALRDEPGSAAEAPVRVALRNAPQDARLLEFQKTDGSTVAAIWRSVRCWDPERAAAIPAEAQTIIAAPDRRVSHAAIMTLNGKPEWTELAAASDGIAVPVGATVVLLRAD